MKKALAICLSILFVCCLAPSAEAAEKDQGLYLSIGAGYSMPTTQNDQYNWALKLNNGPVAKGSVGYSFKASSVLNLRTEFEISYRRYAVESASRGSTISDLEGNVSYLSGMVNGLCDFKTGSGFTPFIGIGLGMSQVTWSEVVEKGNPTNGFDDSSNVFAYQVMGGVGYALTDSLTLDFEYRYFHASDVDLISKTGTKKTWDNDTNHSFLIGLRYLF